MVLKVSRSSVCGALWVFFFFPGGVTAAEKLNLVDGYWDTYVTIRVQGGILPVPAIKSSKCITHLDPLPNSVQSSMRCQISDQKIVGNDVSWRLQCADDKGKIEGQGKITYAGEAFSGGMDVSVVEIGGGRHMKMQYAMRGNRVSACDGEPR
jgi:hypothetical protein